MKKFAAVVIRWFVRAALAVAALVLFLGLLAAVLALGLAWALRALWARLRGKTVAPWAMPIDPREGWRTVYRSHTHWTGGAEKAAARPASSHKPDSPLLPRRPLPGTDEVTDVQPHAPRRPAE